MFTILQTFFTGINGEWIQLLLHDSKRIRRTAYKENRSLRPYDYTRNNGQESITAEAAGLSYESDGSVDNLIKKQARFTWFLAFNQHKNYEIASSVKYDEQKVNTAISNLKCMQPENTTEPLDAHIEEKNDKFEIVPEEQGNALKTEETSQDIINALVQEEPRSIWKQMAVTKNLQSTKMMRLWSGTVS